MHQIAEKQRIAYFDWLRLLATFAVIMIHVCTPYWMAGDVNASSWQILNLFESISRWAAPLFFMISGVLFLGGSQNFASIVRKYIAHLVCVFAFWSAVYIGICFAKGQYTVPQALSEFLNGYYHMWYLHVIIGLYLAVPVLRKIAESREVLQYYLLLSVVFNLILPHAAAWESVWDPEGQQIIARQLENLDLTAVTGYAFYFMLGHYLHTAQLTRKQQRRIYILGVCGVIYTAGLTAAVSLWQNEPVHVFYEYLTPNVACICAAVFVFAKEHFSYGKLPAGAVKVLQKLSKYSLGVYLIHPMLYDILRYNLYVDVLAYPPAVSVPLVTLALFAVSFAVTAVLARIPVVKKWII